MSSGEIPDGGDEELKALLEPVAPTLRGDAVWATPPAALFDRIAAETAPAAPARAVGRRWPRAAALAAAAVAVFAVGFVVRGVADDDQSDNRPEVPALAQFALAGTDLAPMAKAGVEVFDRGDGFAVYLTTQGLDAAPAGMYYEGWLESEAGENVSLGTFHLRNGDGSVWLWSGVDIDNFPTVTVTLREVERARRDDLGDTVLVGSHHES